MWSTSPHAPQLNDLRLSYRYAWQLCMGTTNDNNAHSITNAACTSCLRPNAAARATVSKHLASGVVSSCLLLKLEMPCPCLSSPSKAALGMLHTAMRTARLHKIKQRMRYCRRRHGDEERVRSELRTTPFQFSMPLHVPGCTAVRAACLLSIESGAVGTFVKVELHVVPVLAGSNPTTSHTEAERRTTGCGSIRKESDFVSENIQGEERLASPW